jgi:hypothetical protein
MSNYKWKWNETITENKEADMSNRVRLAIGTRELEPIPSPPDKAALLCSCYTTKSDAVMKINPRRVFQVILLAG